MTDERQPDYEAACLHANDCNSDEENYEHLLIDHGYRQGLAARLTPEERAALVSAADELEHTAQQLGVDHDVADRLRALAGTDFKSRAESDLPVTSGERVDPREEMAPGDSSASREPSAPAARLTPEELRAIGDACTLLTGMTCGIEGLPRDHLMARSALPVLKALVGKGAG